uniref:SCO-spondin-like n=1 Tax=Styela clava TaxID=7725 RepID=UPI001939C233|nr:SCO-spondin-like [Styela clava]
MRLWIAALMVVVTTNSALSWDEIETSIQADREHDIVKRQAVVECLDLKGYCKQWAKRGHCARPKYRAYMRKNCKVSCGLCKETKVIVTTTAPEECVDNHRSCAKWKEQKYCENAKYRTFMKQKCRKTCQFCQDTSVSTTKMSKASTIIPTTTEDTTLVSTTTEGTTMPASTTELPTAQSTTVEPTTEQSETSTTKTTTPKPTTTESLLEETTLHTTDKTGTTEYVQTTLLDITADPTTEAYETTPRDATTESERTSTRTTVVELEETTLFEKTTVVDQTTYEQQTTGVVTTGAELTTNFTLPLLSTSAMPTTTEATPEITPIWQEECEDNLPQCGAVASYCGILDVRIQCRKTCGFCQTSTAAAFVTQPQTTTSEKQTTTEMTTEFISTTTTDATTETSTNVKSEYTTPEPKETTPVITATQTVCTDSMPRCAAFVNYCKASEYVREVCPLTCDNCQGRIKVTETTEATSLTSAVSTTQKPVDFTTVNQTTQTAVVTDNNMTTSIEDLAEVTKGKLKSTDNIGDFSSTVTSSTEIIPESKITVNSTTIATTGNAINTSTLPEEEYVSTEINLGSTEVTFLLSTQGSTDSNSKTTGAAVPEITTSMLVTVTSSETQQPTKRPSISSTLDVNIENDTEALTTMQAPTTITISTTAFVKNSTIASTTSAGTEECADKFEVCSSYSKVLCATAAFERNCLRYCGVCDSLEEVLTTAIPSYSNLSTISPGSCEDSGSKCSEYKKYCTMSEDVRKHCMKTCNSCDEFDKAITSPVPSCTDYSTECSKMKSYCIGSTVSEDVRAQCPKTCSLCDEEATTSQDQSDVTITTAVPSVKETTTKIDVTTKPDCRDHFGQCDKLISFCGTREQVKSSCPLTCGICTPTTSTNPVTSTAEITHLATSMPITAVTFRPTTTSPQITTPEPEIEKCEDKFARCGDIYSKCNEPDSIEYLRVSCRKTCGFCKVNASEIEHYRKEWGAWGPCSTTCGQGTQTRRQACVDSNVICPRDMPTEQRGCQLRECIECENRLADASCEKYKRRGACGMPAITGLCIKTCDQCEDSSITLPVQEPQQGNYSPWSNWGVCSAECGQGIVNRSRTCQPPTRDVSSIFCNGHPVEEMPCIAKSCISGNTTSGVCEDKHERCESWSKKGYCEQKYTKYMRKHCAVSCNICGRWGNWSDWSPCSVSCGGGIQQRTRVCDTLGCVGDYNEMASCNPQSCEVNICEDMTSSCLRIDATTKCKEAFYSSVCERTCGLCPASGPGRSACFDRHEQCTDAAADGKCNDVRFKDLCPRSCNACPGDANTGSTLPCTDKIASCKQMEQTLNCRDAYIQQNCKATCGLCEQTQAIATCEDLASTCAAMANTGQCRNPTVAESCQKSCGFCRIAQFPIGLCVDDATECPNYAAQGRCRDGRVATQCKKSCGQCTPSAAGNEVEVCVDQSTECPTYKIMGYCQNPAVQQQCRQSCEMCGGQCMDKLASCNQLADLGYCDNPDVAKSCGKSCNICQQNAALNALCKDESELCQTYAALRYCEQEQIASRCRKSCNTCPKVTSDICTDNTPSCIIYKATNLCNNTVVSKLCPLSCGTCNCKDSMSQCPMLVSTLKCTTSFVAQQCKLSCGTCPGMIKADTCKDKIRDCSLIKNLGQCQMPQWSSMCEKTCELCGVKQKCEDSLSGCSAAATMGLCNTGNINMVCRKSCRICTPVIEPLFDEEDGESEEEEWDLDEVTPVETLMCEDENQNCESLRDQGLCSQKNIRDTCNMTCRVCVPVNPGKLKVDDEVCIDGTEECKLLTQGDSCSTDERIRFLCAKSCDTCVSVVGEKTSKSSDCRDTIDCSDKSDKCDVPEIKKTCKKTCGVCDTEGANPNPGEYVIPTQYGQCRDLMKGCSETKCKMIGYEVYIKKMCANTCGFCNVIPVVPDEYGVWGNWGSCTVSCGRGTRKRNRVCKEGQICRGDGPADYGICGKEDCEGTETSGRRVCKDYREKCAEWALVSRCKDIRYKFQMAEQCRLSCGLCEPEQLGEWSECSVPCGGGTRTRTRGNAVDIENCNTNICQYGWDQWSQWSQCDVTCGNGESMRTRECLGENEEEICDGPFEEVITCNSPSVCPDVGEWGPWVDGACDTTCGEGILKRERICRNGVPGKWGCPGKAIVTALCSMPACPTSWSLWSSWSSCTKTCGSGLKSRERKRIIYCKENVDGCPDEDEQFERCNEQECNPASWGSWQPWTSCTATCGGGSALRQRFCEKKGLRVRYTRCNGTAQDRFESGECHTQPCPAWGSWTAASECSVTCGVGVKKYLRECLHGNVGVDGCSEGDDVMYETCKNEDCNEDCQEASVPISYLNATAFTESANDNMNGWDGRKWCLRPVAEDQWIQVDFGKNMAISGVEMEGVVYEKYMVVKSSIMTFNVSHSTEPSKFQNHYVISKQNATGPTKFRTKVTRSWKPVYDRVWRISTKLPTDFTCFYIKFYYCTYQEKLTNENNKVDETFENGSGEMF